MQSRTNTKHESLTESLFRKKSGFFSDSFFNQKFLVHNHNKRDLRASGLSLLPLALRPLLLVFLMTGFIFIFQNSNASATSLTLTIPNSISLKVKPEDKAAFNKSEESILSIKSDANFGYTLSIKSKNTNNDLINGDSKITSILSPLSESDFNSSAENNTWGYLPSKFNSSDNTDFQPGPTDSESILDKTSSSNDSDNNNYKITLAAKTDNSLVAGAYKNTFVLTASANTVSYSITYNLESGSWNGTSPQTGSTIENSVNISSVTPTKSEYSFEGWCDTTVTNNLSTNPTCSGTKYSVGGVYSLIDGTNNLNLYAMWKVVGRSYTIYYRSNKSSPSNMPPTQSGNITSPYNVNLSNNTPTLSGYVFKGWCTNSTSDATCSGTTYQPNTSITIVNDGYSLTLYAMWEQPTLQNFKCSSLSVNQVVSLKDSRDNNTYQVTKLSDNKCWMKDNLLIIDKTLTPNDSDVSQDFTLTTSDGGFIISSGSRDTAIGARIGYYNWYTATAKTGTASMNSEGQQATNSICPKGWHLPTKTDIEIFTGSGNTFNFAGGHITYSYDRGVYSDFTKDYIWTSTVADNSNIYDIEVIYYRSTYTSVSTSSRYSGLPIRCVTT